MRTYKFRGKRVGDLEWLVGDLLHTEEDNPDMVSINYWDEVDGWMVYPVYHDSVGQFTGVLDKNGKEIYEGDIVEMEGYENRGKIIFLDGGFCLKLVPMYKGLSSINGIEKKLTVIGNVDDNPELLEE